MADARRSYGQVCPTAIGTEAIADRWTLLVLRDLAQAPLRFSELEASNPGISPSLLSRRLRDLQADGLVAASEESGSGAKRYELSAETRSTVLRVLAAVTELGLAITPHRSLTIEQWLQKLEAERPKFLARHHRTEGSFRLEIDDVVLGLTVGHHVFAPTATPPDTPTATIKTSAAAMGEITLLGRDPRDVVDAGELAVSGETDEALELLRGLTAAFAEPSR